ncbi:hypothetical protein ACFXTO_046255 [Malus domestica]
MPEFTHLCSSNKLFPSPSRSHGRLLNHEETHIKSQGERLEFVLEAWLGFRNWGLGLKRRSEIWVGWGFTTMDGSGGIF